MKKKEKSTITVIVERSCHPTEFFDQWGDWKKDLTIDNEKIRKMGE